MHGLLNKLRANMVRVDTDFSATPFKAKISNAEQLRVHPADAGLVIGGRDPAVRDRRDERPSPRQRPARREAQSGSGGGHSWVVAQFEFGRVTPHCRKRRSGQGSRRELESHRAHHRAVLVSGNDFRN
jgi:hypothetical protein